MTMASTQTYNAGDVLTADSLTKHVTEAYPTALGAALSAAGFDITALDELAFTDAVAGATVVGRIRRNGANLEWHNGTASGRLFFAGGADVPVADGGTGLSSGTSGGVPYFSAAATIASSGALTANAIVLGGGAGAAPAALGSLGSTTTLLHGNASGAPTFSAVDLTADVSNQLPLANGGTAANLSDPGADRVLFWDESSNVITWLTLGTGFTITGTTVTTTAAESGTWGADIAGSRANDTIYQNTSGKKRRVSISALGTTADVVNVRFDVGSASPPATVQQQCHIAVAAAAGVYHKVLIYYEIPNNWYYRLAVTTMGNGKNWHELDE